MPMFDPNQALPNFEAQQIEVDRQNALAQMLRKQPMNQPQGQMVSNHFVAPNWMERLVPVLRQFQAIKAEKSAAGAQQDLSNQQNQYANQWRNNLPQATPAVPYQEGSPDVPGLQDGSFPTLAQPKQAVTREAILKHTLEGLANPRTQREAGLVNQSLTSDLVREEDLAAAKTKLEAEQRFRAGEAELTREEKAAQAALDRQARLEAKTQDLEFKKMQLEQTAQDKTLGREQQLIIAKMLDGTKRELAAAALETKALLASMKGDTQSVAKTLADDRLKASADKELQRQVEHYGTVTKDLVPLHQSMQAVQDIFDKYENNPKKIPGVGYSTLLASPLVSAEANRVRRQIKTFANAVTRAQAGLSQTLSEQANVDLENMQNGKFSDAEFVRSWPEIMAKYNATIKHVNSIATPAALEEIKGRGGYTLGEVVAKPKADKKSALPKTTGGEEMPPGMDPARWKRLVELRRIAAGGK